MESELFGTPLPMAAWTWVRADDENPEISLWKVILKNLPAPPQPQQPSLFDVAVKGPGVYIHSDGTAIKIGKTAKAESKRRKAHQTGNPRDVILLAWIPGACEKALHRRFAHLRIRIPGEWFRMGPDLMEFIQAWRLVEVAWQ